MQNTIAYYRKQRKWTQEQLAQKVGVKRISISMYERGEQMPPVPVAMRIAAALRVQMPKLFPLVETHVVDVPNDCPIVQEVGE